MKRTLAALLLLIVSTGCWRHDYDEARTRMRELGERRREWQRYQEHGGER